MGGTQGEGTATRKNKLCTIMIDPLVSMTAKQAHTAAVARKLRSLKPLEGPPS
jgi:hypothetical protein